MKSLRKFCFVLAGIEVVNSKDSLILPAPGGGGTPLAEDGKSRRDFSSEHKWGGSRRGRPNKYEDNQ